jgi:hypothetical protein
MAVYCYCGKIFTEEEIDLQILEEKKKDQERYLEWCRDHRDKGPPFIDDEGKVCHGAEFLDNGGGVGLFGPETEVEWDQRMAAWKERIKYDSADQYYEKRADCYLTFYYEAGKSTKPVMTVGNTKQFPHYYLLRNKAEFGDALKGIGDK